MIRIIALRGIFAMKKKIDQILDNLKKEIAEEFRNRFMQRLPCTNYEYVYSDWSMIKIPANG